MLSREPHRIAWLFSFLLAALSTPANASSPIVATSPVDGARYVTEGTGILVRYAGSAGLGTEALAGALTVSGSRSGVHAGTTRLARDGNALLFAPSAPFLPGETVTVALSAQASPQPGRLDEGRRFTFTIAASRPAQPLVIDEAEGEPAVRKPAPRPDRAARPASVHDDELPPDFPDPVAHQFGATAPGVVLAAGNPSPDTSSSYLMILGNDGDPIWYLQHDGLLYDFRRQENGQYTYYDDVIGGFVVMDSTLTPVGTRTCGNGYTTDVHELRLLPNGHSLLMSYDRQTVDMSQVVPGGKPNALVSGLVIQELDADQQVVFQWRSWDHFQITDCIHQDLTKFNIDYVHANALDVDLDGNILLSSRHLSEITKIDRTTGDILWRWGGMNNQFTFTGDTLQFSFQHAIRHLPNGHYTLFDNGNWHTPQFSRACEYALDPVNHTAQLVWSYRMSPDVYGAATGFVERMPNGNTFISWGTTKPDAVEVGPEGTLLYQLNLPAGVQSYRISRAPAPVTEDFTGVPHGGLAGLALLGANPVHGSTELVATLPAAGTVALDVLDVQRRVVASPLPAAWRAAGSLRIPVTLAGSPAGVYFARLRVGSHGVVRRMVLAR